MKNCNSIFINGYKCYYCLNNIENYCLINYQIDDLNKSNNDDKDFKNTLDQGSYRIKIQNGEILYDFSNPPKIIPCRHKMNIDMAREIRIKYENIDEISYEMLAEEYNVSKSIIASVIQRKTFREPEDKDRDNAIGLLKRREANKYYK